MKLRYNLVIALCALLCAPAYAAQYGVNQTIRQLNIGTETSPGVVTQPGQIKMNNNPINGLPKAMQSGQPCTFGDVSAGCNTGTTGGGGTVGSGTAGQIGAYPVNGTAIIGAGSNNHGLFAYEAGGLPNTIATVGGGQLLISEAGADPVWLVVTGDMTINAGAVTTVSKINGITPGGTCSAHTFMNMLTNSAVPGCAQPAFTDISGTLNLATQTTGAISLTTQVSGVLPILNGGNGTATPTLIAGSGIVLTGSWPNYTISAPGGGTVTNVTASAPLASTGGNTPNISITSPLPIANGGTGTTTPGLIAGAGITLSGSWPNQTIAAPAVGTVTNVTASAPLASSGGTTPAITLTGIVPLANGGTQCQGVVHFASLPGSPVKGMICSVDNSSTCTAGTPVDGSGSTYCLAVYDGTTWQPAGGATSAASGGVTAVNASSPITSSGGTTPTVGLNTVPVNKGGTGATSAGATAANNIGAAELGANSSLTSLTGLTTPLAKSEGGTGTTTPGDIAGTNVTITGSFPNQTINAASGFSVAGTGLTGLGATISLTSPVAVANGGTNATSAGATAAHNIGAAALGANSDITSLGGLTTPLSVAQGGTGTNAPGLIAGSNVTISGSWPNQTINSTGGGSGNCGNTTLTTIAGTTAGTASCYTPCQSASLKTAVCNLNGYENSTGIAQSYTFNGGTTFTVLPTFALGNSNPPSAVTATTIILPINQTLPFTGPVGVSGF